MWFCTGGTRAQPGYCDHVWAVEASRKYRAQRLHPDATTVAPGENAFFADSFKERFAGVEFLVLRGYSDLEAPVGQNDGGSVFYSCNSSENQRLIRNSAGVLVCDIVSRD